MLPALSKGEDTRAAFTIVRHPRRHRSDAASWRTGRGASGRDVLQADVLVHLLRRFAHAVRRALDSGLARDYGSSLDRQKEDMLDVADVIRRAMRRRSARLGADDVR